MGYHCIRCGYTTKQKSHIKVHIDKKNPCKPILMDINVKDYEDEILGNKDLNQIILELRKTNIELLNKIEEYKKELNSTYNHSSSTKSNKKRYIVNNTINGNIIINFNINGYENTSHNHLNNIDFKEAIDELGMVVPKLIENIHFNPKKPSNHNIYINNKKERYAKVFDGKCWNSAPLDELIDRLIDDKETIVEEWLLTIGDRYPDSKVLYEAYKNGIKEDNIGDIKERIKLLLYNNRDIIKNTNKLKF